MSRNQDITDVEIELESKEKSKTKPITLSLLSCEMHRALYFRDIAQALEIIESKLELKHTTLTDESCKLISEKNLAFLPALARLFTDNAGKADATTGDIYLLMSCIVHDKPKAFSKILALLNTHRILSEVKAQFYYLAMYLQHDIFSALLKYEALSPPYTMIYLTQKFMRYDLEKPLWKKMDYATKRQAIKLLLKFGDTGFSSISKLPNYIQDFIETLGTQVFDEDEEKKCKTLTLPALMLPKQQRNLTQLAYLAKKNDFLTIFREFKKETKKYHETIPKKYEHEKKYFFQLMKQHVLEEKSNTAKDLTQIVLLLRCVYGSDIMAYQFILNDCDLQKQLYAQEKLLRFYETMDASLLPTEWLADLLLYNKPLQMPQLRRLIYLTEAKEQRPELHPTVLDQEQVLSDDYKKSLPFLKKLGDPIELATKLRLKNFILTTADYLPTTVPFSPDLHLIIGEYLEDEKEILAEYPALQASTLLLSQKHSIQQQIDSITLIIAELQTLPQREISKGRLLMIGLFLLILLAVPFIIASHFVNQAHIDDRSAIINSADWQQCQADGYYAVSVPDPNTKNGEVSKGECKTLTNYTESATCDQLCANYNSINFSRALYFFDVLTGTTAFVAILAFVCLFLQRRYCPSTQLAVPDNLRNKIYSLFHSLEKPRPQEQSGKLWMSNSLTQSLEDEKVILQHRLSTFDRGFLAETKEQKLSTRSTENLRRLSIVITDNRHASNIQSEVQDPMLAPLLR